MRIVEQSYDKEIVLALGLFDSVHRGHVHLISEAKNLRTIWASNLPCSLSETIRSLTTVGTRNGVHV